MSMTEDVAIEEDQHEPTPPDEGIIYHDLSDAQCIHDQLAENDSVAAVNADAPESHLAADDAELETKKLPFISPIVKKAARSRSKMKFPPPFPDLIHGYHFNDVLSGRGATVNAHPGNKRFRSICAHRKSEFAGATNIQKRQIALEIVETVFEWNPPGRFIERAKDNANCNVGQVDEIMHTSKKEKKLKREMGPWRDMGIEKAIQKTCGVIRDHNRPDRIALRVMGQFKKKRELPYTNIKDSLLPHMDDEAPSQDANANTAQDDDISSVYRDIVPTANDVLLGRGAFINDHTGNYQFRNLANVRKARFDAAAPAARRTISMEIIMLTKALNPPGRFLKRAPYALREPVLLSDGKYELPPRGLEGPWEEVSEEKEHAKAIQVLRDMKNRVPKSDEIIFEEAEQVAALASVNASMKDSIDVEEKQGVVMARVNDTIADSTDYHVEMPELPAMADGESLEGMEENDGIGKNWV